MSTSLTSQAPTATTLPAAVGLTVAALLAAAYNLVGPTPTEPWLSAFMMSAAALMAWLSVERLVPRLPSLPPGDLPAPIGNGLVAALGQGRRLADTRLPLWRDTGLALVLRLRSAVAWRRIIGRFESALNHWPTALVILALLGLIAAALGAGE